MSTAAKIPRNFTGTITAPLFKKTDILLHFTIQQEWENIFPAHHANFSFSLQERLSAIPIKSITKSAEEKVNFQSEPKRHTALDLVPGKAGGAPFPRSPPSPARARASTTARARHSCVQLRTSDGAARGWRWLKSQEGTSSFNCPDASTSPSGTRF